MDGTIRFRRLILWAGIFPPDIDFTRGHEILSKKDVVLVYGNSDPFLSDERFAEMKLLSEKLQITPKTMTFDGGHVINEDVLLKLREEK
jgi:predicted esterase